MCPWEHAARKRGVPGQEPRKGPPQGEAGAPWSGGAGKGVVRVGPRKFMSGKGNTVPQRGSEEGVLAPGQSG